MSDKYRVDPNFVVPEPAGANFFAFLTLAEYSYAAVADILGPWNESGVKHSRITLVNDEFPHPPYPHGYWLEGWAGENVRQLPFGEAEEVGGPIYPPLVECGTNILATASGIEAATAGETTEIGSTEGESPTAESGDAQTTQEPPHDQS